MNHVVLARKYRPRVFAHVVGQDIVVATLKAAIEKDRVAHAMLFTGSRGIGKTTIARIVAKALVCTLRKDFEPCGSCSQCVSVDNFSSLDVLEIDGASHTGVDDIRELRDSARFQPSSAKYKIFIIDEVHMLSISAFNALLKILEEPPEHVVFMFATTEVHKIPKTILSRCQRYDLKRMPITTIFATLKRIMNEEGFNVDDAGLHLIATLADGGMRDALSMMEQVVSNHRDHYSAEFIAEVIGVVSAVATKDICQALINADVATALMMVKNIYDQGLDLCQLMDAMTERFRVMSLCAHMDETRARTIVPALEHEDFVAANSHDKAELKRMFAMAVDAIPQVFHAERPLLALELFILRAALRPSLRDAVNINYCLQKLDALMHNRPLPQENSVAAAVPVSLSSPASAPAFAAPASASVVSTRASSAPAPKIATKSTPAASPPNFVTFVNALQTSHAALASHLRHARPIFSGEKLTLVFEQSLHFDQVSAPKYQSILQQSVTTMFGSGYSFTLELKKSADRAVKTVAELDAEAIREEEAALLTRARNNPLVKKALEIFGGDITEVKKVDGSNRSLDPKMGAY